MLGEDTTVTAFRAESEVQQYFEGRDDGSLDFEFEQIYFDTQGGSFLSRMSKVLQERYRGYRPQVLPFSDRLEGYDLIQSWELFTDWTEQALDAKAKFGIPVSLMVWDNIAFNNEPNAAWRARKERAVREADRFIVHTERSRRVLDMEGVQAEKIVMLPTGVDDEHFSPGVSDREKLGFSDDEFVILFIGWMLPRKGLDFLVLALRELVSDPALKNIKFKLAVVASGPGRERIEMLLERLGLSERCTFLGTYPYDEMPDVYRAADCFVLPSIATETWQEQFGMSLIEAMSSRIPVVSTYSGSIPEIAGDAARLCQPNDFLELYMALKSVVQDEAYRRKLSSNGRDRVLQEYTLQGYTDGLKAVYSELLK
jgi:alpha-maltose-1-phosphate synthase